jgi:hypothetical protein
VAFDPFAQCQPPIRRRRERAASAIQVTKMIRRKSLIMRLLGIVTWTMTLAMLLTVMLRSRSSQGERKGN